MMYKCTSCGKKIYGGCLPSVSCGLMLLAYVAIAAVLVGVLSAIAERFIPVPSWLMVVASVPAIIAGSFVVGWIIQVLEWGWMKFHRCPECGSRKWSKGYTVGFGL